MTSGLFEPLWRVRCSWVGGLPRDIQGVSTGSLTSAEGVVPRPCPWGAQVYIRNSHIVYF